MTEILGAAKHYPSPKVQELRRAVDAFKSELGVGNKQLTVVLTDDGEIQALNREHLAVDAPTDVLSFPLVEIGEEGFPDVAHLGDIVVSLETARRQAEAAGHSLEREVATLIAHGLTHLLGFDHPTEEAWERFRDNQTRLVALLSR